MNKHARLRAQVQKWADRYLVGKGHANSQLYAILAEEELQEDARVDEVLEWAAATAVHDPEAMTTEVERCLVSLGYLPSRATPTPAPESGQCTCAAQTNSRGWCHSDFCPMYVSAEPCGCGRTAATGCAKERDRRRCDCCDRADEYNGYGSDGPIIFTCPKHCACHD